MKILLGILKYPPDYAGDGMRLHRTFQRLRQRGNVDDVYVLTSWDQRARKKNETLDGIRIFRPVESTLKKNPFLRRLRMLFIPFNVIEVAVLFFKIQNKVDVVMTAGSGWFPSLIGWFAYLTQKPLVKEIVLLGSDDPVSIARRKPFWIRWFFTAPFHFAKLVIVISPALQASCLQFGLSEKKIWCRFNPVDFEISPEDLVRPENNEAPALLWVGSISKRKNVEFLVKAAAHLTVPAQVWFVGPCYDAPYMRKIEEARKKIPGNVQVRFWGEVKDRNELKEFYKRAQVFWFASEKEGMGNVVAEALACGTPVVALPVMGIMKQVIPTKDDGEVIETDDPAVFAQAACRWLYKDVDHAAIAERALERFNSKKVDEGYVSRLQRIALNITKPEVSVPVLSLKETVK